MDTGIPEYGTAARVHGIRHGSQVEDDVLIDWSEIYVMIDFNCGN